VEARSRWADAAGPRLWLGEVIFNIRGNRYRLVTVIHCEDNEAKQTKGHVYVRSFLTHKEYDNLNRMGNQRIAISTVWRAHTTLTRSVGMAGDVGRFSLYPYRCLSSLGAPF
jgi:hypothetical protein